MKSIPLDVPVTADSAIVWRDDALFLLDQRELPARVMFVPCPDVQSTAEAITAMVVRGAPAIGITAAYGVALAARDRFREDPDNWRATWQKVEHKWNHDLCP